MSKGYIWYVKNVKGKVCLGWQRRFRDARAEARKHGPHWYVCSAALACDSTGKQGGGGYFPHLLHEAAGGMVYKVYTVPWQVLKNEDRAACWCVPDLAGPGDWVELPDDAPQTFLHSVWENGKRMGSKAAIRKLFAEWMAEHPFTEFACNDQGKLKIVLVRRDESENGQWGHFMREACGVENAAGGKTVKRGTQQFRNFLGWLVTYDLKIRLIKDADSSVSRDGVFTGSRGLKEALVNNLVAFGNERKVVLPDGTEIELVSPETLCKFAECMSFNVRVWVPGGILEEFPHGCLIKGQMLISNELEGVQIVTHVVNCKTEVRVKEGEPFRIGVIPQPGKDRSRTNVQYIINAPHVLHPEDVVDWVEKEYAKLAKDMHSGKAEEDLQEIAAKEASGQIEEGHYLTVRKKVAHWVGLGLPLKLAPRRLVLDYFKAKGNNLVDGEKADVKVRIPYAVHRQLVSKDAAQDAGYTIPNDRALHYIEDLGVFAIGNEQYTEQVVKNHGGCDGDDFFDLVFRQDAAGKVWVFVLRSPCGWGEWSVFPWNESRPLPRGWDPKRLPRIRKDIPSPKRAFLHPERQHLKPGAKASWDKRYDKEEFLKDIANAGEGAGKAVNAFLCHILHLRWSEDFEILYDTPYLLGMEKLVDVATQCDNPENTQICQTFVKSLSLACEMRARKGLPMDRKFMESRKVHKGFSLPDSEDRMILADMWFSELVMSAEMYKDDYLEGVEALETVIPDLAGFSKKDNQKLYDQAFKLFMAMYRVINDADAAAPRYTREWYEVRDAARAELAEKMKIDLAEVVPYLAYKVYHDAKEGKEGNDEVLTEDTVFFAYAKWLSENLERVPTEALPELETEEVVS